MMAASPDCAVAVVNADPLFLDDWHELWGPSILFDTLVVVEDGGAAASSLGSSRSSSSSSSSSSSTAAGANSHGQPKDAAVRAATAAASSPLICVLVISGEDEDLERTTITTTTTTTTPPKEDKEKKDASAPSASSSSSPAITTITVPRTTSALVAHVKVLRAVSTHPKICLPFPIFVHRVARYIPSAPAVDCGGLSMSYSDLVRLAIEVRDYLYQRFGIARHSRVSLVRSDDPESWLAFAVVAFALALLGAEYGVLQRGQRMTDEGKRYVLETYRPQMLIQCNCDLSEEEEEEQQQEQEEEEGSSKDRCRQKDDDGEDAKDDDKDDDGGIDSSGGGGGGSDSTTKAHRRVVLGKERNTVYEEWDFPRGRTRVQLQPLRFAPGWTWAVGETPGGGSSGSGSSSSSSSSISGGSGNMTAAATTTERRTHPQAGAFHCAAEVDDPCLVDWTSGTTSGLPKGLVT
eukprot:g339.t1